MLFRSIVSVAMMASSALAAIAFNSAPNPVEAGKSYTLTWTADGTGPVSIQLRRGEATNLLPVQDLTTTGSGGSFTFTAPDFPSGSNYAFVISQDTSVNYWGPISYVGSAVASSSAPVSAPVSSAPASVSSAAPSVSGSVSAPSHISSSFPSLSSLSSNATTKTLTASTSKSITLSTSATPSASATTVPSTGGAAKFGSPLALVLSAVAAMLYLS